MTESRLQRVAHERRCSLFSSLQNMRQQQEFTDIVLKCQHRTFPAHKAILAAGSQYLRMIFQEQKDIAVINVHEVEEDLFTMVIEFLYTGELHFPDPHGNRLEQILILLKNLDVRGLDSLMGSILVHNLNPTNFAYIWKLTRQCKQKGVEFEVAKFIARNLDVCWKSPNFSNLSLQQVMSIMSAIEIPTRHPKTILKAIATWGIHNPGLREKYVPSLLSVVGLMSEEKHCLSYMDYMRNQAGKGNQNQFERGDQVSVSPVMTSGTAKQAGLLNTVKPLSSVSHKYRPQEMKNPTSTTTITRTYPQAKDKFSSNVELTAEDTRKSKSFFCPFPENTNGKKKSRNLKKKEPKSYVHERFTKPHGSGSGASLRSTSTYLVRKNVNEEAQSCDSQLEPTFNYETDDVYENDIYCRKYILCLGHDQNSTPIQQCYNMVEQLWMPSKPMIRTPAENVSIFLMNRILYFIGGETDQQSKTKSVFSYQLDTRYLRQLADLTIARSDAAVVQVQEVMYVIGGRGRFQKSIAEVECYNSWKNIWTSVASMRIARVKASVTSNNSIIYVAGGYSEENSLPIRCCETYDTAKDQWTHLTPFPISFSEKGGMIAMCNDCLYALCILKPTKLYRFTGGSKNREGEWVETNRCHSNIIRVVELLAINNTLWVLDRNGRMFQCDTTTGVWTSATQLPPTMTWPVQVFILEQSI